MDTNESCRLGVKLTVDVRLICYAADFAAQMPNVVFMVELATDSLGVVAEQTVEHSVCHPHTIRISYHLLELSVEAHLMVRSSSCLLQVFCSTFSSCP